MAHAQKPDLVFQRNRRVHLYRRGCQFSRLLAAEVCASAVVMLDRPCLIQCTTAGYLLHLPFPPHFSTRAFPCAITFLVCSTCPSGVFTNGVCTFLAPIHATCAASLILQCCNWKLAIKQGAWNGDARKKKSNVESKHYIDANIRRQTGVQ